MDKEKWKLVPPLEEEIGCSEMPKVAAELVSAENKARTCDLNFRSMNSLN